MPPLFKRKRDVQKLASLERCYTITRDGFQRHKQELINTGLPKKSHNNTTMFPEHAQTS